MDRKYAESVFVNAPFDAEYAPILQILCFTIVVLGLYPRLAPETSDNSVARIDRIVDLIRSSRLGIHDLSRSRSSDAGEYQRMNMPFELGLDHGAKVFGGTDHAGKAVLVLEGSRFDTQRALSDIAGWDVEAHDGSHVKVIQKVRRWLRTQGPVTDAGPSAIEGMYVDFSAWYWTREQRAGASIEDITEYPTVDVVAAMHDWNALGRPAP